MLARRTDASVYFGYGLLRMPGGAATITAAGVTDIRSAGEAPPATVSVPRRALLAAGGTRVLDLGL